MKKLVFMLSLLFSFSLQARSLGNGFAISIDTDGVTVVGVTITFLDKYEEEIEEDNITIRNPFTSELFTRVFNTDGSLKWEIIPTAHLLIRSDSAAGAKVESKTNIRICPRKNQALYVKKSEDTHWSIEFNCFTHSGTLWLKWKD